MPGFRVTVLDLDGGREARDPVHDTLEQAFRSALELERLLRREPLHRDATSIEVVDENDCMMISIFLQRAEDAQEMRDFAGADPGG